MVEFSSAQPGSGEESDTAPAMPAGLTGRQRSLYERLTNHEQNLGAMYAGAVMVIESSSPDRIAQSAHSARELIQALMRDTAPAVPKGVGNPRDKGLELADVWQAFKTGTGLQPKALLDRPADGQMLQIFIKVDEYVEASSHHKTKRRKQVERALPVLGLSDTTSPEPLKEADTKEWKGLWDFFERATHHGSVREDEFRGRLAELESLLMRWIPETFADLDELDALMSGGEGA